MTKVRSREALSEDEVRLHDALQAVGVSPLTSEETRAYMTAQIWRTYHPRSIINHFFDASGWSSAISLGVCAVVSILAGVLCYIAGYATGWAQEQLLVVIFLSLLTTFLVGSAYLYFVQDDLHTYAWRTVPICTGTNDFRFERFVVPHPEALRLVESIRALLPEARFCAVCLGYDPILRVYPPNSTHHVDLMIWDGEDIVLLHKH